MVVYVTIVILLIIFVNDKKKTLDEIDTILYNAFEVIYMFEMWNNAVVTKIGIAMYVHPGKGKIEHNNRQFHGFVLNCEKGIKDYCFSDGRVMRTEGCDLFYLPKGSSYYVKSYSFDGCYAINFDVENEIECEPFVLKFRNNENLFKVFKGAEKEWRTQSEFMQVAARRAVYDIIFQIHNEYQKSYLPDSHFKMIAPAIEKITSEFSNNSVSVADLAKLCGISEAYFRRIFTVKFGVSPKEYIISKRIGYAGQLLEIGDLTVSEVAELCGYTEISHFSREFTRRVGIPPSEYKKAGKP